MSIPNYTEYELKSIKVDDEMEHAREQLKAKQHATKQHKEMQRTTKQLIEKQHAEKQQLRKLMEARRQLLTEEHRQLSSESISRQVIDMITAHMHAAQHQATILLYMPFRNEVNITPLIRYCWEASYTVTVPKVDKALRTMDAYEISSFEELEPGTWGIPEPNTTISRIANPAAIDVIIVPGLAYDHRGGRLGYGSGCYDRFIEQYEVMGLPHPLKLGVCYDIQLQAELPMEQHDLRVDRVITEVSVYEMHH